MKKFLSMLLVLIMLLSLAPVTLASGEAEPAAEEEALPAEEEAIEEPADEPVEEPAQDGVIEYPLWVGGVQVTNTNTANILGNNSVRYDRASKTLIFNDLTGFSDYYVDSYDEYYGVYAEEDLTVTGTANFTVREGSFSSGISVKGVLTIADGADLTINTHNDALFGSRGVIINGGTINVTSRGGVAIRATGSRGLVVNGGTVNATAMCFAFDAQNGPITVNGGTVTGVVTREEYAGIRLLNYSSMAVNGGVLDVTNTAGGKALLFTRENYEDYVTYASTHAITEGSLDGSHFRIAPWNVITRVDFTALNTELTAGKSVKADAVPASGSHFTVVDQFWRDGKDEYTGNAEPGKTYQYVGIFRADKGYTFGSHGTMLPVYLNGAKLTDGYAAANCFGYEDVFYFTISYKVPAQKIDAASITVTAPSSGASVTSANGKPVSGSHFTIEEQYWCSNIGTSSRLTSGTFRNGELYYYYALLVPDAGYEFAGEDGRVEEDVLSVKANGTEASSRYLYKLTGKVQVFVHFYATGPAYTGNIALTGFTYPVPGAPTVSNVKAVGSAYTIKDQFWSEGFFLASKTKDETFQAGKTYYWICKIELKDDKGFPEGYTGPVTLDGKALPYRTSVEMLAAVLNGEEPGGGWEPYTTTLEIRMPYTPTDVLLGDVNNDGKVNPADRAALARYLAKWPEYQSINQANADVNADGKVNPADRAYLARHFAKWPAYATLGVPV